MFDWISDNWMWFVGIPIIFLFGRGLFNLIFKLPCGKWRWEKSGEIVAKEPKKKKWEKWEI